ncbi:MAG: hypothetical protein WC595_02280, partial [Candidatus Nanoarchaeia archaeon]
GTQYHNASKGVELVARKNTVELDAYVLQDAKKVKYLLVVAGAGGKEIALTSLAEFRDGNKYVVPAFNQLLTYNPAQTKIDRTPLTPEIRARYDKSLVGCLTRSLTPSYVALDDGTRAETAVRPFEEWEGDNGKTEPPVLKRPGVTDTRHLRVIRGDACNSQVSDEAQFLLDGLFTQNAAISYQETRRADKLPNDPDAARAKYSVNVKGGKVKVFISENGFSGYAAQNIAAGWIVKPLEMKCGSGIPDGCYEITMVAKELKAK